MCTVSRTSALDDNLNGKIPNGNFVFLSVIRCQVACASRGVNTCDGIVQGCIREKHKSMVQGARAEAKGEGEIVVTDLSRTSGTSGTRTLVPSRRPVPGRSLTSRTENPGAALLAAWRDRGVLHAHVTRYDSGSKVRCGGAWTETCQKQHQGFAVCAQEGPWVQPLLRTTHCTNETVDATFQPCARVCRC